jgi:hypothetical protein
MATKSDFIVKAGLTVSNSLTVATNTATIGTSSYFVSNGDFYLGSSTGLATSAERFQVSGTGSRAAIGLIKTDITASGVSITGMDSWAYDGNTYVVSGTINFRAAESWSNTNHGTDIQFRTTTTGSGGALAEAMRISGNGNVGIGTSSPSSFGKLAVIAASGNQISFGDSSASATNNGYLNYAGGSGSLILNAYSTGGSTYQAFYTSNSGTNAERMRIDSSGNVGIGTSSPGYTLDVRATTGSISSTSTTGTNYAKLQCTNSGGSYQFGIDNSAGSNFGSSVAYARAIWNDSASAPTILYTNSAERMRIDSGGGVRIGITTNIFNAATSEKLSVKNTVLGCAATFQITDATGGYPVLYISSLDTTNSSQSALNFFRSGSSVGSIGTTASATTYNTASDYRLKENVAPITTGLATISALKPITYDWVSANEKGEGFIAHELQEIVPLAVTGTKDAVDADGKPVYQGVDYSKIVVHLVAAIQELSAKVTALESK